MFKRHVGAMLAGAMIVATIAAAPSALADTTSGSADPSQQPVATAAAAADGQMAPQIREDCKSGQACGWTDAYFAGSLYVIAGLGNFYPSGIFNNSMSSIRNSHHGTYATYYDYSGSNHKVCLPYSYENSNLAGSNLQNKISYIQVSGYSC